MSPVHAVFSHNDALHKVAPWDRNETNQKRTTAFISALLYSSTYVTTIIAIIILITVILKSVIKEEKVTLETTSPKSHGCLHETPANTQRALSPRAFLLAYSSCWTRYFERTFYSSVYKMRVPVIDVRLWRITDLHSRLVSISEHISTWHNVYFPSSTRSSDVLMLLLPL